MRSVLSPVKVQDRFQSIQKLINLSLLRESIKAASPLLKGLSRQSLSAPPSSGLSISPGSSCLCQPPNRSSQNNESALKKMESYLGQNIEHSLKNPPPTPNGNVPPPPSRGVVVVALVVILVVSRAYQSKHESAYSNQ